MEPRLREFGELGYVFPSPSKQKKTPKLAPKTSNQSHVCWLRGSVGFKTLPHVVSKDQDVIRTFYGQGSNIITVQNLVAPRRVL